MIAKRGTNVFGSRDFFIILNNGGVDGPGTMWIVLYIAPLDIGRRLLSVMREAARMEMCCCGLRFYEQA